MLQSLNHLRPLHLPSNSIAVALAIGTFDVQQCFGFVPRASSIPLNRPPPDEHRSDSNSSPLPVV
jgi:hypothetical protein